MWLILLGMICLLASGTGAWILADKGMDVLAPSQWVSLIESILADPVRFQPIVPLVLLALLPLVPGIVMVMMGIRRRNQDFPQLPTFPGERSLVLDPAPAAPSSAGVSATEDHNAPVWMQVPDAPTTENTSHEPFAPVRRLKAMVGRWMARHSEMRKARAERAAIAAVTERPSLGDRLNGMWRATGARIGMPMRQRTQGQGTTTLEPADATPAQPDTIERAMRWYGAWGALGRGPKPSGLLEEARALAQALTPSDRLALLDKHGMSGVMVLSALKAVAEREGEMGMAAPASVPASAPMEQPPIEELLEEALRHAPPAVPEPRPTTDQDPAGLETFPAIGGDEGEDSNPFADIDRLRGNGAGTGSMLDLGDDTAQGAAATQEEPSGNILDIEDDIGQPQTEVMDAPENLLMMDQGARRLMESIFRHDDVVDTGQPVDASAGFEDAAPGPTPHVAMGPEEIGDDGDERSSTTISNEAMEKAIAQLSQTKLRTIVGEGSASAKSLQRELDEIGLGGIEEKNVFVPALWAQLDKAVEYQTRAYAWEHFGEEAPAELATAAKREEYLIRLATSIVTLRDQIEPRTIEEIMAIKKGAEQIAWLSGRADLILKALTSPENRARLRSLVRGTGEAGIAEGEDPATPGAGMSEAPAAKPTPRGPLDMPIEDMWKIFAPVVERYKQGCYGEGIDVYRSLQISHRPDDPALEPEFGVVDAIIGNLRVRQNTKIAPMKAGTIGIMFVPVPAGHWTLEETEPGSKDKLVLVGAFENAGQTIRVRDRNLAVFAKWSESKGFRAHGVLHFVLQPGASIANLPAAAGGYELRTDVWTAAEWEERRTRHIMPRRAA